MHRMTNRPSCWASYASQRCAWAFDRGACCGGLPDDVAIAKLHELTPGCDGCARQHRAWQIVIGEISPYIPEPRGRSDESQSTLGHPGRSLVSEDGDSVGRLGSRCFVPLLTHLCDPSGFETY